jgi:hypothetical protein
MSALSHTRTCSQNLFPTPQRKNLIRQLPRSRFLVHYFQKTVLLPVLQRTYATSTEKLRPLEICSQVKADEKAVDPTGGEKRGTKALWIKSTR